MSWHPVLAWSLAGLALLLAGGAWRDHRVTERDRLRILDRLHEGSLDRLPPQVAEDLRHESDPTWRRLQLARTLVTAEMDPEFIAHLLAESPNRDLAGGTDIAPEGSVDRLSVARDLAAKALAERPAVWQASMLLGAATYLLRSRVRDPKLLTAYRDWEAPLELAVDRAPGKAEPGRFLAVAYLELWPVVSKEKRETARALMADAFRDPGIFRRLADVWLTAVEDRREAFASIPPEPEAWGYVGVLLGRRGDWEGVREARLRYHQALEHRRERDLEEGRRRLDGGDLDEGRRLLLLAATRGRPEPAAVPVLVRALSELPPGPPGRAAKAFHEWLRWSLDLCLRDRCPLPPATLDRVTGLSGELEPAETALADLFTGDLAAAERIERRTDRLWHPEWSPYLLAKARLLARRGEPEAATAALEDVHPSWRERTLYRWTLREVTRAGGVPTEHLRGEGRRRLGLGEPETEGAGSGTRWPASAWRPARDGATDRLDLWLPAPNGMEGAGDGTDGGAFGRRFRLLLRLAAVPPQGAVVEVRLDGEPVTTAVVRPGDALPLAPPETPELHLLEMETLAGGRVLPGEVLLSERPAPPTGPEPLPRRSSRGPTTLRETSVADDPAARSLQRPEEPPP